MKPKTCELNCFNDKQLDKSVLRLLNTLVDYVNNYILNNDVYVCITAIDIGSISVITDITFLNTTYNITTFEMLIPSIITNEIADNIHDVWKNKVKAIIDWKKNYINQQDEEKELYD